MYYRRKILLSLIQCCDGKLEKIRIQKLLFLYSQKKNQPEYEFIPYSFGCFSYSLNADLNTLVKKNILSELGNWLIKNDNKSYINTIDYYDKELIDKILAKFGSLSNTQLVKYTYIHYPYYAHRSTIAKRFLNKNQVKRIKKSIPLNDDKILFTIGYEGISLEKFLNKLLQNGIKVLVDVRKNPQSMKYGFSKKRLKDYCNSLGIKYMHFPEVGIISKKRKKLKSLKDYEQLFDEYKKSTLRKTRDIQEKIYDILIKEHRIALTCFEANESMCHRKFLAESIYQSRDQKFVLKHL